MIYKLRNFIENTNWIGVAITIIVILSMIYTLYLVQLVQINAIENSAQNITVVLNGL